MRLRKHTYIASLLLLPLLFIQCNKTNWVENFREKEKSPFGTYVLYNEAATLFDDQEIILLKENIADYLDDIYNSQEKETSANYICIKTNADKFTKEGTTALLEFVAHGNTAFLSLNYFNDELKEALEITTKNLDGIYNSVTQLRELNGELYLENKHLKKASNSFTFDRNIRRNYFNSYNPHKTIVLGTQQVDSLLQPNFIKIYHGKGSVYLHTHPIVFTNYFLLNGKEQYAANLLSYLPSRTIFWDPQIKLSKNKKRPKDNTNVFSFFLKHPSLKWSLYVAFFSLLLFIIFNARRKQRAVPIISELKNSTLEFTHTIANLYRKEENHKNAVDKKINFFLEKVRTNYLLNTTNLNTLFIARLASKSGNTTQATNYLINTIITLNKEIKCTQEELIRLNILIENFLNSNTNERNSEHTRRDQ